MNADAVELELRRRVERSDFSKCSVVWYQTGVSLLIDRQVKDVAIVEERMYGPPDWMGKVRVRVRSITVEERARVSVWMADNRVVGPEIRFMFAIGDGDYEEG